MQHEPTTSRRSEDDSSELANGSIYPESSDRGKTQQAHPLKKHEALRECASYAALIPMAFFGVLIRLGMDALGDYDGRSVYPLIWAQGIGCAIMGTALELKGDLMQIYPPLFAAITTGKTDVTRGSGHQLIPWSSAGLAGSITTFSSWMLDGFGAFANLGDYSRGGLYDVSFSGLLNLL
ncbi:hypothetical protein QFC21_000230 [Naganishia friedmannii]|uniref:Uncharacterized protein n=1 Tax=Naganishia friedmannii TaxID=89922 RepID=A0ACC2WAX1_9TREE|nr:hypothetical protein QFC21_000230 [Naganishia friedmannii]